MIQVKPLDDLVIRRRLGNKWDGKFKLDRQMRFFVTSITPPFEAIITLPVGFETDLASIPRQVWLVVSKYDYGVAEAAVLHDYMYLHNIASRAFADDVMREAMREYGVPEWRVNAVHKALRVFGRFFYNKKQ